MTSTSMAEYSWLWNYGSNSYFSLLLLALAPFIAWRHRGQLLRYLSEAIIRRSGNKHGADYLEGNFAPVCKELFKTDLPVTEGAIPEDLNGAYIKTGPNPYYQPLGGYHWFDGDGMVHACRINGGRVSYCNRWVDTSRLRQERQAGWPVFYKLGDLVGFGGIALTLLQKLRARLGVVDLSHGTATANTALVAHAQRILVLNEGDLPYGLRLLCSGLVESVGRLTAGGQLAGSFTAHPKVDPETGALHFFRYSVSTAPFCHYGVLSADGTLLKELPIELPDPIMMHDFAITRSYAVFMDSPLKFTPEQVVKQRDMPFVFDRQRGSRVGLLPLDAKSGSEVRWFHLPSFMVFHTVNAWEDEGGRVHLFGCHHDTIRLSLARQPTGGPPPEEQPKLCEYVCDPATGSASSRIMTATVADFPVIHPQLVGRRSRWAYMATMVVDSPAVKFDGIAKFDLQAAQGQDALVSRIAMPPNTFCGEAVFVPRHERRRNTGGAQPGCPAEQDEDDGFLVAYVHDELFGTSSLCVYDARGMAPEPLARVALPQRVPYGFHGLWVPESQVQAQLARA